MHIWLIIGSTISGTGSPGSVGLDWMIQRVGDFNGDGRGRHSVAARLGVIFVWLVNGLRLRGTGSTGGAGWDWTIQGVGDFNGTGG